MGKLVQMEDEIVYQQDDGEITAWLTGFKEKMVLEHKGSERYKRVFYISVAVGLFYLIVLFSAL
jgi:hypothetical protein